MSGGPDLSEILGSDAYQEPCRRCPSKFYSLSRVQQSATGEITSTVCASPPAYSRPGFYVFRVRPTYANGHYLDEDTIRQIQLESPFVRTLLKAVKSGSTRSVEQMLSKMYLKSVSILHGSLEIIFCEAPIGMELFTERVVQFFLSRFNSFDEYAHADWDYCVELMKSIHRQYLSDNRYDGTGKNRMFSCIMDARSSTTTLRLNDGGSGHSYVYAYSLGVPTNEALAICDIDSDYAALLCAIFYGVAETEWSGINRDEPKLKRIMQHRANLPVPSVTFVLLFGLSMGLLESEIKKEFQVHHYFGPERNPMRECLNTFSGLTPRRFIDYCEDYIERNPCCHLPTNHPMHGMQRFIHRSLDRDKPEAKFPSTLILLIQLYRLPNQRDCKRMIKEVVSSYGTHLSSRNRLASPGDVALFTNDAFLNAPVHIQAQYISIDIGGGHNKGMYAECKSFLEKSLGRQLPMAHSPSSFRSNSRTLRQLDTPANRIKIGCCVEIDGEVYADIVGDLTKQELLLIHFLDRFNF
jgi:hypothetical protein